ncbi:ABC transporter permease [Clostridium oryzae]|uniref:Putative multiple-sugar transport system permease YteP n=1 Tax=Clostridium oryzae TaxID=1450648 RepID=A0A1V4IL16_9CLOT|nr:ABC transporter permease subunit [Clostridium oryzae]OPJ60593.1 putative multiple-sugar transport system permease YteP [Clostridium oryzae]
MHKFSAVAKIKKNYQLYLLILPTFIYFIIFKYVPMYGILLAFKDYIPSNGIIGSPWVGFKYFHQFFSSYQFSMLIKNTVVLSIEQLIVTFPLPIVLALMLNQLTSERTKKFMQTVVYAPYFISTVVLVGIMIVFLSADGGIINVIIKALGGKEIYFFSSPKYFRPLYVFSSVWQGTGFAAVIYIAGLSSIDPQLHEAAIVDGASKFRRMLTIDLPGIAPIILIQLILAMGGIMNVGFEKAFLMQTNLNLDTSEIIQTYVYKIGLQQAQYEFGTAVGLFQSVINLVLLVGVNKIVSRFSEDSLW